MITTLYTLYHDVNSELKYTIDILYGDDLLYPPRKKKYSITKVLPDIFINK